MNITAIIQARTGSTRLPEKVLAEIQGKPLLTHVFERISYSRYCHQIVLATTQEQEDDRLGVLSEEYGVLLYRGSTHDVLDRYFHAAKTYEADIVVRVTADDPFKDPGVADKIIEEFLQEDYDYVSNTLTPTYPEGLDIEVFSFNALQTAYREAQKLFEREHVTPYIWMHPEKFVLKNIACEKDYSAMRWTIDTPEDLAFARAVYQRLYHPNHIFLMEDILRLLEAEPVLMQIMPKIPRNLGLKLSQTTEANNNKPILYHGGHNEAS